MRSLAGLRAVAAIRLLPLVLALTQAACLVVSVRPAYDDESLMWEPALLGRWEDSEDRAELTIEPGEWKSYRIRYTYAIESGQLTGFMTAVGDDRYLDVMPAAGQDHGSFLLPLHLLVKVVLGPDRLELTPMSYDWFYDRLKAGQPIAGLPAVLDQKDNALVVASSAGLRNWLRKPAAAVAFGPSAVFEKKD